MKKPIVGVVPLVDAQRESLWMLPGYLEGILAAGGLPLVLPLTEDAGTLEQIGQTCDAILLTGGQDVSPQVYGGERLPVCGETCPSRDGMEAALLRQALAADKPVLGICRGIQFLNAALGGTLYQDLPTQKPSQIRHQQSKPYHLPSHTVALTADTPLARLLGKEELGVNSCHHQAIRDLSPRLGAMALSPDGLVEAVWMPERSFVWAVQWHPEISCPTDGDSRKLFAAFVAAAG